MADGVRDTRKAYRATLGAGAAITSKLALRTWPVTEQQSVALAQAGDSRGPSVVGEATRGQHECVAGLDFGAKHAVRQGPRRPPT